MANKNPTMSVFAPLTGKVIDIVEVQDDIFAKKTLGDGVAIIPDEGSVFSPVNGNVVTVAGDDKHAFTFQTDEGVEIMVHIGTDTAGMDCSAFNVYVKEGQRVQAGDLVAEIDLNKITMAGRNIITPVIICGGLDGFIMHPGSGHVIAGAGSVFTLEDFRSAPPEVKAKAEAKAEAERGGKAAAPAEKAEKAEKTEKAEKGKKKSDEAKEEPKKEAKAKGKAKAEAESALDFINKPGGLLKAGLALLIITVLMVACFVSVAIFTMGGE